MNSFCLALTLLATLSQPARSDSETPPRLSPALVQRLAERGEADVLVFLKAEADLAQASTMLTRTARLRFVVERLRRTAASSQGPALALARAFGARAQTYYVDNAIAIPGASRALVAALAEEPSIDRIRLDAIAPLARPSVDPMARILAEAERAGAARESYPANVTGIFADRVWNELGARGSGIVVGGQDTGYDFRHPALRRQYRGSAPGAGGTVHDYSWHDAIRGPRPGLPASRCGYDVREPCDDDGHGTHTMGSLVGDAGPGERIGVAPEAKWIGCRSMSQNVGYASAYLECFEFFLAPYPIHGDPRADGKPELAPHVINNSWSCPPKEGCVGDEFVGAVRALRAAGILVVVAAGNDGPRCGSLANAPGSYVGEVVSVAAYNRLDDALSWFSNRGPSRWNGGMGPDLAAPGNLIRSAVPPSLGDGEYDYKAGTSMASPHVAGAVALLWSARPALIGKIDATIDLLRKSATPRRAGESCGSFPADATPNPSWGYGLLNAYELVRAAPSASAERRPPSDRVHRHSGAWNHFASSAAGAEPASCLKSRPPQ